MKYKTAFVSTKLGKCKRHPTYKVMLKPTADCEHCRLLWTERVIGD